MWCEHVDAAAVILPFVLQYFEFTPCVAWTAELQHPVVCGMCCEMCSQTQHQGCKCHSWVCQFSSAVMSLQSPLKERTHPQANRLNTACSAELESLSRWQNVNSQLYTRRDYFAQLHKDFRVLPFVRWASYWCMRLNNKVTELTKCSLILFCNILLCGGSEEHACLSFILYLKISKHRR